MRNRSIDIMKGILTLLMISCHLLYQTVSDPGIFNQYVNLTTFSGFLFCFGFASYAAYFSRYEKAPVRKLLRGFLKTTAAYYISAFMLIFLLMEDRSAGTLMEYVIQKRIAGYAEFLLSFSYLYLLIIVLFNVIKKITDSRFLLILAVAVSLLATYIPYDSLTVPWLGPVIGMGHRDYFPLLQYISYFLVGAYVCKNRVIYSRTLFAVGIVSNLFFVNYLMKNGHFPQRWGVSLIWIIGGYLYIYLYYVVSNMMAEGRISSVIEYIGQNTLLFLVCSNFFVFAGSKLDLVSKDMNKAVLYITYWIITVGACFAVTWLFKRIKASVKKDGSEFKG